MKMAAAPALVGAVIVVAASTAGSPSKVFGSGPAPTAAVSPSPRPSKPPATPRPAPSPSPSPTRPASASPKPGRTFTNDDLPSPSPSPSGWVPPPPARVETPDDGRSGGQGEAFWRVRGDNQRRKISESEALISQLEQQIATLRNDLAPTNLGDPNREQTRQAELNAAVQELERAKQALQDARKGMDDLEDEARRNQVPPGWLRER